LPMDLNLLTISWIREILRFLRCPDWRCLFGRSGC
jgi:hypothetical protein